MSGVQSEKRFELIGDLDDVSELVLDFLVQFFGIRSISFKWTKDIQRIINLRDFDFSLVYSSKDSLGRVHAGII